jgi:hypothetical protein
MESGSGSNLFVTMGVRIALLYRKGEIVGTNINETSTM